jgi:ubiquinone/menaquinone biosynthesis C-methylase UbiE
MTSRGYVPALSFDALTRFYDPLVALTLRERKLKGRLLEQARIAPGHAVLDVGCGTGTLALMAKQREPRARVVGLDGDPAVLAIARRKLARAGVAGFAGALEHGSAFTPFGYVWYYEARNT